MLLGELPALKKLMVKKLDRLSQQNFINKRIDLSCLEVIQCYHVSSISNHESILTYGLIPSSKPATSIISYEPRLFVSVTYEDAAFDYVGFDEVDVWSFYCKKESLFADEFSSYANHYYLKENVPWYKLSILETIY